MAKVFWRKDRICRQLSFPVDSKITAVHLTEDHSHVIFEVEHPDMPETNKDGYAMEFSPVQLIYKDKVIPAHMIEELQAISIPFESWRPFSLADWRKEMMETFKNNPLLYRKEGIDARKWRHSNGTG